MNYDKKYIMLAVVAVVILASVYVFSKNAERVSDSGAGAGMVQERIDESKATAGNISAGAGKAQRYQREAGAAITRIESACQETGNAIRDLEQFLQKVEQRGKVKAAAD